MRKEIIILLIGMFLLTTSFSTAAIISTSSSRKTNQIIIEEIKTIDNDNEVIENYQFSIEYSFEEPFLSELRIGDSLYTEIRMEGLPNNGDVGLPELPVDCGIRIGPETDITD